MYFCILFPFFLKCIHTNVEECGSGTISGNVSLILWVIWLGKSKGKQESHGFDRKWSVKWINKGSRRLPKTMKKNYRKLRNELKRAIDKAKKEYLQSKLDDIMQLWRTGCYDDMVIFVVSAILKLNSMKTPRYGNYHY